MRPTTDPINQAKRRGDRHWHQVIRTHPEGVHVVIEHRNRWLRWATITDTRRTV